MSHHGSDLADWNAYSGVPLLRTVVGALLDLSDVGDLSAFELPYPAEAQRALDRVTLRCLLRGAEPPHSLPDLLAWCRERPVADWPIELPADAVGPDQYLLDPNSAEPSSLCHEWALDGADSAVRDHLTQVIGAAFELSRQAEQPESYSAFRRLLVEQPVLDSAALFRVSTDQYLDPVRELVEVIYHEAPDGYLRDGGYTPCRRCGTLLTPLADGGWWCERDVCRRFGVPSPGEPLRPGEVGVVQQLDRALRQFVTGPGRTELELEARLLALGLDVAMWPGYDAYDLRITFPDGHVWALDVKDRANPALLGRQAAAVRQEPRYDEAFWVVPAYRVELRRDYLAVFARHRPASARDLELRTDYDIVRAAAGRLRRKGTGHA